MIAEKNDRKIIILANAAERWGSTNSTKKVNIDNHRKCLNSLELTIKKFDKAGISTTMLESQLLELKEKLASLETEYTPITRKSRKIAKDNPDIIKRAKLL